MVEAADAAKRPRRDVPRHAVVAEVGERMAERRELPVEHRDDARLGRVKHQVVEPVVAVHDAHLRLVARARRNVRRQPFDEPVHRLDRLGDRGEVLLGPAADLALEVVARLAVVGQADAGRLDRVQRGDDAVHLVVDRGAAGVVERRQRLVPEHAAVDELHDVEGAADDALVFAQQVHARHRHVGAVAGRA